MKLRISALLVAALLAGCGFTDATNRTGTDFLASQGVSISARDSVSVQTPVLGVQVIPVEGIPAPNGLEGLWLGGALGDSIRAVVAFDLSSTSGPDAAFQAISAANALSSRFPLTHIAFGIGLGGNPDTVTSHQLHVRFLFLDSATQTLDLPGLFMGMEPLDVDPNLQVFSERDSQFVPNLTTGIPLGPQLRDSLAARLKAGSRSWLVAILDGHPGWETVFSLADPRLHTDSTAGTFIPGTFQGRTAWRSSQMRRASAPTRSLGWWVGGGNRLRVSIDGDALRNILHQRFGKGISTDSFDNSYNILQARVQLPFVPSSFKVLSGSADDRGIGIAGAVVLDTHALTLRVEGTTTVDLPISLGSTRRTELGLTVDPHLQFDDSFSNVHQGRLYLENSLSNIPTRLSLGEGSTYSYVASNFWLRKDIADSLEFRISSVVRVRVSSYSGDPTIHVTWFYLRSSPVADLQYGVDSIRSQSRMRSSNMTVRQEVRTSVSLAVIQKKFSVDIDIVPTGGTIGMQDLWESVPSAANVLDSLGMIVRPRDGGAF